MSVVTTILVVEDEPDICELVRFHLELEGFIVRTASNGVEGLEAARESTHATFEVDEADAHAVDLEKSSVRPEGGGTRQCRVEAQIQMG